MVEEIQSHILFLLLLVETSSAGVHLLETVISKRSEVLGRQGPCLECGFSTPQRSSSQF